MYRSEASLPFFSAVVKNVANPNIEVKKLVYIYLLHHAEAEPDLALLSINTIQKSLTDQNAHVRAMALRTMSGIRVPVISQIVSLAIKRGCGDMSAQVRKAAALSIPKCYRLDPTTLPQLVDYVSMLLGDSQYFVVGPAVAAFLEVCPDRIDLVHKHYRSMVRKLVDMDEWGQLATLRLLTIYARKCFPRKSRKQKGKAVVAKAFYDEGDQKNAPDGGVGEDEEQEEVPVLDPDLELFLRSCKLLLQSRTSAVIVSVVRCFLYLAPSEYLDAAVGPLVALLRSPQDIQYIALYNIVAVSLRHPKPFAKHVPRFLVRSSDPATIWRLKLEVLTIVFPHCGLHFRWLIINELEHFLHAADTSLVQDSVRAIGRCAQTDTDMASHCLRILVDQMSSQDDELGSASLTVIRHLIQQDPTSHVSTVIELVKHLGSLTDPVARASIIWLVGEYAGLEKERNFAPDVLRVLVKGFADESETAKQQIVLLGARVYLHHLLRNPPKDKEVATKQETKQVENTGSDWAQEWQIGQDAEHGGGTQGPEKGEDEEDQITLLWRYVLLLARYDVSYDLRDRARLYKALLSTPSQTQLASLLLLAPKPVPHAPTPSEARKDLMVGSSTLVVGPESGYHGLRGYETLPDWVEAGQEPDGHLREESTRSETPIAERGPSMAATNTTTMTAGERLDRALKEHEALAATRNTGKNALDQWLQEDSETETEEETEEETDEEETEEEEDDEEDEEEETDDDESGEEDEEEEEEEEDEEEEEEEEQEEKSGSNRKAEATQLLRRG